MKFLLMLPVIPIIFFSLANFAFAQIQITEIMYDLEGSDSGREWVEIYNPDATDVDLSGWKFFENNTNHAITPDTISTIQAGGYAIIADNTTKFLADNPNFSGLLFDSSFSLNNTGETISIRDSNLVDIDSATYNSDMGAAGDGNSLQKVNGSWVSASPTVGAIGVGNNPPASSGGQNNSSSGNNNSSGGNTGIWIEDNNKIYADAGKDKIVIVGADTVFKGEALGIKKEPLINARFLWNFGDGTIKEGNNILHNFRYPGEYVVFLDVSSGKYSSSDRVLVKALPSSLSISSVNFSNNSYIEIQNSGDRELDISFWRLRGGNNYFTIPHNTYILPNKKIIFGARATGLQVFQNIKIALLYPNGETAYSFTNAPSQPKTTNTSSASVSTKTTFTKTTYSKNQKVESAKTVSPIKTKQEKINTQINIKPENASLGAAVSMIDESGDKTSLYKWLTALVGLVFLSIGGVLFIRSKEIPKNNIDTDEIEIIE